MFPSYHPIGIFMTFWPEQVLLPLTFYPPHHSTFTLTLTPTLSPSSPTLTAQAITLHPHPHPHPHPNPEPTQALLALAAHLRLQPPLPTVAASTTHGCSLHYLRLQALLSLAAHLGFLEPECFGKELQECRAGLAAQGSDAQSTASQINGVPATAGM